MRQLITIINFHTIKIQKYDKVHMGNYFYWRILEKKYWGDDNKAVKCIDKENDFLSKQLIVRLKNIIAQFKIVFLR